MKKNYKLLIAVLAIVSISGCEQTSESISSNISDNEISESNNISENESIISSSKEEISSSDGIEYTTFMEIGDIYIDVNEDYYLKDTFKDYKGLVAISKDSSIATYNLLTCMLNGVSEGETYLTLKYKGQNQKVRVVVGDMKGNYTFSKERLYSKKLVAFGDSVTADATIQNKKTYSRIFAENFKMTHGKNYAIGGTTATYMYPGSNIELEYGNNQNAIDGCRVVYKAYKANELNDVDYAFIAYGHNDQYFQPPIDAKGDDVYCVDGTFASCNSYKGSYRYMINVLRLANPDIRIILMNCTYSEYQPGYGGKLKYDDYRKATQEVALEMNCKYIDPWEFTRGIYDFGSGNTNYSDVVHLTAVGHQKLATYLCAQ